MTRVARIILGLSCCLITGLIILGEGRTPKGTLLAAELSVRVREEMESRFRIKDEEDLQWKPLAHEDRFYIVHQASFAGQEPILHNNLGIDHAEQGRYDQAIAEFTMAVKDSATYGKPYYNRGTIYARQGRQDLAIPDLSQAIEIDPDAGDAWHNRGVVYTQKGQYEQALSDFNQILKLKSEDADSTNYYRTKILTQSPYMNIPM